MSLPPGPSWPRSLQTLSWTLRPVALLRHCRERYGRTFSLRLPIGDLVLVSEPEAIRQLFTMRDDEVLGGTVNRILRAVVGDHSVLVLDGLSHRRQRRLLSPPFHGERMRHYGRSMQAQTLRRLREWPQGRAFALHPHFQAITLEVILECVFGLEDAELLEPLRENLGRLLRLSDLPFSLLLLALLSSKPELQRRWPLERLLRSRNRADAFLYRLIQEQRAEPVNGQRSDVLTLLLQARDEAGEAMSDVELRDELVTLLLAGHETTATELAWAFECLLANPSVLERLVQEVRAGGEALPSPERIQKFEYLDATVKEVLRTRPVLPIVPRVLTASTRLSGYDLPAGTIVGACAYLTHHDPAIYRDPETFRPERFLGESPEPAEWLPFGGGMRRCLGSAFALYEMKIVMATVLAQVDLERVNARDARFKRRSITLAPRGGTRVRVRRRAGHLTPA